MSDTPAMSRPSGGLDDFERRIRMSGQAEKPRASTGQGLDDPLAELARLVGQEDPFRGVFPQARGTRAGRPEPLSAAPRDSTPHDDRFAAFDQEFRGAFDAAEPGAEEPSLTHDEPAAYRAAETRTARAYPAVSIGNGREVEQNPDVWAQGGHAAPAASDGGVLVAEREPGETPAGGSSRRTLTVLAAVVILTGGGLAASFLAKPSVMTAAASASSAPTIMAATGPSKVQPDNTAADQDAAGQTSTLLDKNNSDGTATAKVVNTTEQPVDLSQAVKPAAVPAADDARPLASSPFPEPKKVRTVMVRPDGSIIASGSAAVAPPAVVDMANGATQQASLAFDPRTSLPLANQEAPAAAAAPVPVAQPSTPKAASAKITTRAAAMPKVADAETTDATPASESPAATPKPARAAPKPKPVEQASAAPDDTTDATASGGGAYAVQLGAPGNEQEAHDVAARLQKKFAEQLGSHHPSIRKAQVGDRSIFRIRVAGLSLDDAKAMCSKLQSGGGACFVVKN